MKKIFVFLLLCVFSFFGAASINKTSVLAVGENKSKLNTNCEAKASILIDAESGEILHAQNEFEHLPIASMTKIMTLLLAFEEIDSGKLTLQQDVLVSENASGMGGSQVFLDANESYKLDDLIKSIVVSSANDASVAVAELISGDEQSFVQKMNEKAKQLGMENTNFVNCTGLPAENAYSCARDVSIMFKNLIIHENYFNYSKIYLDKLIHPSGRETELSNTNKLVRFYAGCDGGKTGSTSQAKFCLCATAKKADLRVIACVIGCENAKIRNAQVSNLFNFAFNNFVSKKIISEDDYFTVPVKKGDSESLTVGAAESFSKIINKNNKENLTVEQVVFENLTAPILKGQKVGEIKIFENDSLIKTIDLVSKEDVKGKSFISSLKQIFSFWNV